MSEAMTAPSPVGNEANPACPFCGAVPWMPEWEGVGIHSCSSGVEIHSTWEAWNRRAAPPADAYTNPCVKCAHPSYYHFADRNGCIQCGCELEFWPSRYERAAPPADGEERPGEEPERTEVERFVRYHAWLGHGHAGQYGDDGEMQCAECAPFGIMDYKRAPIGDVLAAWGRTAELQLAREKEARLSGWRECREAAAKIVRAITFSRGEPYIPSTREMVRDIIAEAIRALPEPDQQDRTAESGK